MCGVKTARNFLLLNGFIIKILGLWTDLLLDEIQIFYSHDHNVEVGKPNSFMHI